MVQPLPRARPVCRAEHVRGRGQAATANLLYAKELCRLASGGAYALLTHAGPAARLRRGREELCGGAINDASSESGAGEVDLRPWIPSWAYLYPSSLFVARVESAPQRCYKCPMRAVVCVKPGANTLLKQRGYSAGSLADIACSRRGFAGVEKGHTLYSISRREPWMPARNLSRREHDASVLCSDRPTSCRKRQSGGERKRTGCCTRLRHLPRRRALRSRFQLRRVKWPFPAAWGSK